MTMKAPRDGWSLGEIPELIRKHIADCVDEHLSTLELTITDSPLNGGECDQLYVEVVDRDLYDSMSRPLIDVIREAADLYGEVILSDDQRDEAIEQCARLRRLCADISSVADEVDARIERSKQLGGGNK